MKKFIVEYERRFGAWLLLYMVVESTKRGVMIIFAQNNIAWPYSS